MTEKMEGVLPRLVAVYARVSTSRQEEDGTIEGQLGAVRDYAQTKGLLIAKEYKDEGWSGDVLARPALDLLRQDARNAKWKGVLIYDPDRLARRYSYQELVMDELREAGVEVIFVTIPTPNNPEEKILHGVRGLFAEFERNKIKERFRLGRLRSIKEGNAIVGVPAFGYRVIRREKPGQVRTLEIVPDEARIVQMVFTLVGEKGFTTMQVAKLLTSQGIRPRKTKRWNTSTVHSMLRNEIYIGRAHWYRSYNVAPKRPINQDVYRKRVRSSRASRKREDWLTVAVPAVITEALFEKVQSQLVLSNQFGKRNKKREYLLGGIIYCGCNKKRHGRALQGGKYKYYACYEYNVSYIGKRGCEDLQINAIHADELVWNKLKELISTPTLMQKQILEAQSDSRTKEEARANNLPAIQAELKTLKEKEKRFVEIYGEGLYSLEELKVHIEPLRNRILALESERLTIIGLKTEMNVAPSYSEIENYSSRVKESLDKMTFSEKRQLILQTIERVIATGKTLEVVGHIYPNTSEELSPENVLEDKPSPYLYSIVSSFRAPHDVWNLPAKIIPFKLIIELPPSTPIRKRTPRERLEEA